MSEVLNKANSKVDIIAYPFGYAAGKESAGHTPELIEYLCKDIFIEKGWINDWIKTDVPRNINREKFTKNKIRNEKEVYTAVNNLANNIAKSLWSGNTPLVLGGDHSQGTATAKATMLVEVLKAIKDADTFEIGILGSRRDDIIVQANLGNFNEASRLLENTFYDEPKFNKFVNDVLDKTAIVWLDSHGDYNNPQISGSGNFHGQSLRAVVRSVEQGADEVGSLSNIFGGFLKANPKNVYVLGHRDLDEDEITAMSKDGVNFVQYGLTGYGKDFQQNIETAKEKSQQQFSDVVNHLVKTLEERGFNVHLSFDTDVTHGRFVIGTGTPQGVDVGKKIPISGRLITKEMVRENFASQSPAGPPPSEVYDAVKGSALKRATDNTEISGIHTIEHENGTKSYEVDYSGIIVGIKSIISMIAPEDRKLIGKDGMFREMAKALSVKFPQDKHPECWESGKFNNKPLIDAYYAPIISRLRHVEQQNRFGLEI